MGNNANIVVGLAGAGADATGLAWFAPTGTTAPVDHGSALAAGWVDMGLITEEGLTAKFADTIRKIKAYGSTKVQRTVTTDSEETFDLAFLEHNRYSLAVYHRKGLTSITPSSGAFSLTSSGYNAPQFYAATFEIVDGSSKIRAYCNKVEVTQRGDMKASNGNEMTLPVTLTAYPNTSGVSIQWFYNIPNA